MTNYLFKYEPLYVARAENPVFDERFIGFGMTRNTQVQKVYLMYVMFEICAQITIFVKYSFQGTFYYPKSSKKCVCTLSTFY